MTEKQNINKHYMMITIDPIHKQFGIIISDDAKRLDSWADQTIHPHQTFYSGSGRDSNRTKKIIFQTLLAAGYVPFPKNNYKETHMKLTLRELNKQVREFAITNKDLLRDNLDNMCNLPEVAEFFATNSWTLQEYQEVIRSEREEMTPEEYMEVFVKDLQLIGIPDADIQEILESFDV